MSRSSELAMAVRERERRYGQMNDEELRIFVLKYSKDKITPAGHNNQDNDESSERGPHDGPTRKP